MSYYNEYIENLFNSLKKVIVTDKRSNMLDISEGISSWCDLTHKAYLSGKSIFFIGNGASATMSSHMAADACKNGGLRSLSFNDAALITAVSNDICYEESFSLPIIRYASEGDMLISISSSGSSSNIVKAIEAAKDKQLIIITLSGMKEDNKSRKLGDLNFYIPANEYGPVEVCHQALLHCWLDKYINSRSGLYEKNF